MSMNKSLIAILALSITVTSFAANLAPVTNNSVKEKVCSAIAKKQSAGYFEETACFESQFFYVTDAAEKTIVFAAKIPSNGFLYTGVATFNSQKDVELYNLTKSRLFNALCTDTYTEVGMVNTLSMLPAGISAQEISFDIAINKADFYPVPAYEGTMTVNGHTVTHNMNFKNKNCKY